MRGPGRPSGPASRRARRSHPAGDRRRAGLVGSFAGGAAAAPGIPSNLLAHHLDVLEQVGLITRSRSSGDGRRRYVHLLRDGLDGLLPGRRRPGRAGAVRVHRELGSLPARRRAVDPSSPSSRPTAPAPTPPSGCTPAPSLPPDGPGSTSPTPVPARSTTSRRRPALVITVCDRAHEELDPARRGCTGRSPIRSPRRAARRSTPPSPSCAAASPVSSACGMTELDARSPRPAPAASSSTSPAGWSPRRSAPACSIVAVIGSGIMASRLSPDDVGLQLLENAAATAGALIGADPDASAPSPAPTSTPSSP